MISEAIVYLRIFVIIGRFYKGHPGTLRCLLYRLRWRALFERYPRMITHSMLVKDTNWPQIPKTRHKHPTLASLNRLEFRSGVAIVPSACGEMAAVHCSFPWCLCWQQSICKSRQIQILSRWCSLCHSWEQRGSQDRFLIRRNRREYERTCRTPLVAWIETYSARPNKTHSEPQYTLVSTHKTSLVRALTLSCSWYIAGELHVLIQR